MSKQQEILICDEKQLQSAPSNHMMAKNHSRVRLKGDLDSILIDFSILEGLSPKTLK